MKQKIKAILDDDRGVSPVIGVILMVAITVILAAVIGTFVLGLGDSLQTTPQTSLSAQDAGNSYSLANDSDGTGENAFLVTHSNGDELTMGDVRIVVRGSGGATVASFSEGQWNKTVQIGTDSSDVTVSTLLNGDAVSASDTYQVGDTIQIQRTVDAASGGTDAGIFVSDNEYTIQVIHVPSGSTLSESTVTLN